MVKTLVMNIIYHKPLTNEYRYAPKLARWQLSIIGAIIGAIISGCNLQA